MITSLESRSLAHPSLTRCLIAMTLLATGDAQIRNFVRHTGNLNFISGTPPTDVGSPVLTCADRVSSSWGGEHA